MSYFIGFLIFSFHQKYSRPAFLDFSNEFITSFGSIRVINNQIKTNIRNDFDISKMLDKDFMSGSNSHQKQSKNHQNKLFEMKLLKHMEHLDHNVDLEIHKYKEAVIKTTNKLLIIFIKISFLVFKFKS